ncbi:hypothetical protein ACTNA4_05460 [Bariatricus sp. HCP28S3_A7]|uniref:hypothetical protein n=1 Tax=Bariatricus sp. HCP28S3_A7 TaxID=3438894 RepID=UPI003F8AB5B6
MLNEDKVKLMTRMAMYESKEGTEDFKISSYYRKDYSSFHTIVTIIWVTIGYMIAVGVGAIAFMDVILENLNFAFIIMIGLCVLTGYIVLVVFYGIVASRFYQKKHNDARQRVKKFNHDLTRLNRMYEREKK